MKPIGGYFELELDKGTGLPYNGLLLASCRNALEVVLSAISPISLLWIPHYTCSVISDLLLRLGIRFKRYCINEHFEIMNSINLDYGHYLLYTNYFGIKDSYVNHLSEKYGDHLIVDNAQALFSLPSNYSFYIYSPRKFVGIPDGGIAVFEGCHNISINETDVSFNRCSHLLKRIDLGPSNGYADYTSNSNLLGDVPVRRMSNLTNKLLDSIDFERIKRIRRQNFTYIHSRIKKWNLLSLPEVESIECPMVYPLWPGRCGLKQYLIDNNVFVATYWPNILQECPPGSWEYIIANEAAFLPIDQRYDIEDMNRIIDLISQWM